MRVGRRVSPTAEYSKKKLFFNASRSLITAKAKNLAPAASAAAKSENTVTTKNTETVPAAANNNAAKNNDMIFFNLTQLIYSLAISFSFFAHLESNISPLGCINN